MIDNETSRANVVIVGGGIMGVTAAAYCGNRGMRDVFLLEQGALGKGETGASAAMIMANTLEDDERKIQLAAAAMNGYAEIRRDLKIDAHVVLCGSLLVSTTPEGRVQMEHQVALQHKYGIQTDLLNAGEIHQRFPYLHGDDITAGIYYAGDGYVNQASLIDDLAYYARACGVHECTNMTVANIERTLGGFLNVTTNTRETIQAERVVIAAGAHSPKMSRRLGWELPLSYQARTLWSGTPTPGQYRDTPIIEFIDGPDAENYIRTTGDKRYIIAYGPTRKFDRCPEEQIPSFGFDEARSFHERRLPDLRIGLLTGNVGIRTMAIDGRAYLGPIDPEGKVIAAYGQSGYGITHAPFLARVLADYLERGMSKEMEMLLPTSERLGGLRSYEGRSSSLEIG